MELFEPIPDAFREGVVREGERLLAFGAPEGEDHEVRFGALQASSGDSML